MALITLATLLFEETKQAIYERGIAVAVGLGLPVSSWTVGDPTRSNYWYQAEILSTQESTIVNYIAAGFLDWARERAEETGDTTWLKIAAKQGFNVDVEDATHAESTVVIQNDGGGLYDFEPGDLTLKNTTTDKTYHNTNVVHLAPGAGNQATVEVVADEAGSASSAGSNEIDDFVTNELDISVVSSTVAIGLDEEDAQSIVERCRDKQGPLSPNGPRDAYNSIARDSSKTGITTVTRTRSVGDSTTGVARLLLAGTNGAVSGSDRDAVEAAIVQWAVPLTITPDVDVASEVVVNIVYEVWLYQSAGVTTTQAEAAILSKITQWFRARPIGGDIIPPATSGKIYKSAIEGAIKSAFPTQTFHIDVSAPGGDTALAIDEVAKLGSVIATINFIPDP